MINSPSGSQKIAVRHGAGPTSSEMSLAQFRDAVGYSKQSPLPPSEIVLSGIVKMAGSAVVIETTGILDGNLISGLAATDVLLGAAVAGDGIPAETVVNLIAVVAAPGQPGTVQLSNVAPFAPTTGVPQPIAFTIVLRRSTICGLAATDGLDGAVVSGAAIPDGTTVKEVSVPAVAATNIQPGVPGEVVLAVPVVPPPAPVPNSAPAKQAPAAAVPPKAGLTPVDITFAVPTAPIVFLDGVSVLQLSPAEPLASLTVKLAPHPVDGQQAFIYSTLAIAELTILPNMGQSLNWSPAVKEEAASDKPRVAPFLALAADTSVGYLYSAPNSTWDRIR